MSSGSSGRYQSRLFNFVHQQSRRLTQRWEQTFRQVQVATKWGVEALLYPLYLVLQSAESKVKTLHSREPQSRLKLAPNDRDRHETPPTADTPIQVVLEAVQKLPSEETSVKTSPSFHIIGAWWRKLFSHSKTNKLALTQSLTISDNSSSHLTPSQQKDVLRRYLPKVQGIATTLEQRKLVLVTTNNEILDILTPQQQTKILDKIISEVARYWHNQQLALPEQQTELLPEIHRILAKLTGETPSKIPALTAGISPELINTGRIIDVLDQVIAKLEKNTVLPVQQNSQEIIQVTRQKFHIFLYGQDEFAAPGNVTVSSDSLETQTLNFQALIEAAINYFFGVGKEKKLNSAKSNRQSLPGKKYQIRSRKRKLTNQNTAAEPWLKWGDLFGNSELVHDKNNTPPLNSSLSVTQTKLDRTNKKVSEKLANIPTNESNAGEIIPDQNHNHQVEIQPDWIEVKANSIEYEQHLLEKILKWLDRTMLWLEEILVKGVNLLQRLWRGK
ncbi:hypothetical protein [Aulosira sp. FACHB-615]|uniref:hypothetical protein n=1 Tax=Aulosira sp. FACHB-615 TaxID=2692777 RepID=UPI0016852FFA|nr:hypothetical protein [Aulosira sp. FACHB-615]MBD2485952.1 hypothetical protein [Aulosira sp. FACHB-615]